MRPLFRWGPALLLVLGATACDGGPKGPGTLEGTVAGPTPLGAVVLELVGPGVSGVVGRGDTQAYGAVVSSTPATYRVVLVSRAGGAIRFGVQVADLGAEPPLITVRMVAGTDNIPKLLTGVGVQLEG